MNPETLKKAAIAARERAGRLQQETRKADGAVRAAKAKARNAKARLKLAKREAKELRKAAKQAKRGYAEILLAAEKAAIEAASLEKKVQKLRKPSAQGHANTGKPNHIPVRKRLAAKPSAATPAIVKPPPKTVSGTEPGHVPFAPTQPPAQRQ
jgi:chromosome segregation ATPase